VEAVVATGACPDCGGPLTTANFSLDHRHPVCRGGGHALANLAVTCAACNRAKGPLTAAEYRQLLALLAAWPAEARRHTLARLRAGGRVGFRNDPLA
jgi:5-methylcytosine-specific restriction endonuclease McrA